MMFDLRVSLIALFAAFVVPLAGLHAACTSPAGIEGEQIYNTDYATMQFCDNTNWISMAASGSITAEVDPKVGTLTSSTFCKANAGGTQVVCGTSAISLTTDVAGNLPLTNLGGGTGATSSTFWRGDGTWASPNTSQWLNGTAGAIYYSGGNVGIGTTSPVTKLDVAGQYLTVGPTAAGTLSGIVIRDNAGVGNAGMNWSASNVFAFNLASSSAITFGTVNTERMRISSSGNIGIGTALPTSPLTIASNGTLAGTPQFVIKGVTDANKQLLLGFDTAGDYGFVQPVIQGTAYKNLSLNASGGNVGIGTSAPTSKLDVISTGQVINGFANGAAGTVNYAVMGQAVGSGGVANTGFYANAYGASNNYGVRIVNPAAGPNNYAIYSDATAQSYFAGNVGIGTTAPGSALDVKGTLRLSGATSGYVGIAPAAVAGSTTYTLPAADGAPGQVLSTNGAGALSWVAFNSIAADSLNFTDFADSMALDAATTIAGATTAGLTITQSGSVAPLTITNMGTGNSLLIEDVASDATPFVVDASGNVGIGTTTPTQKLSVAGTIESTSGGIKFPDGTTQTTAASGGSSVSGSWCGRRVISCNTATPVYDSLGGYFAVIGSVANRQCNGVSITANCSGYIDPAADGNGYYYPTSVTCPSGYAGSWSIISQIGMSVYELICTKS